MGAYIRGEDGLMTGQRSEERKGNEVLMRDSPVEGMPKW